MNVTTDNIRRIKAGEVQPFHCANARAMHTACALISRIKRLGMPEGVVNYETQKCYDSNIILVHAMKEGEKPILNKSKK